MMKPKSEQMKTLTEREIQSKLYGHLRAPHGVLHDESAKSLAGASSARTASLGVKNFSSRPAVPAEAKPLEFEMPAASRDAKPWTQPAPSGIQDSRPSVSKLAFSRPEPKSRPSRPAAPPKPSLFPKIGAWMLLGVKTLGAIVILAVQNFLYILRVIFVKLFQAIVWLGAFLWGMLRILDFRNPKIQKAFYTLATIGFIAALFAGIHSLNLNRETAMKAPRIALPKLRPANSPAIARPEVKDGSLRSAGQEPETARQTALKPAVSSAVAGTSSPANADRSANQIGTHGIQVATFATAEDAQKLVDRLKTGRFSAFVKPLSRPGGRVYYCVFMGPYAGSAQAERELERFRQTEMAKPFRDAFVRSL